MKGRLISLDRAEMKGRVDTRNDEIGVLNIYFKTLPDAVQTDCTVEFDVVRSKAGNRYAKFIAVADRNQAIFNTENRPQWYAWGESEEIDFVEQIVPRLGIDLRINPEKATAPWEIDLYDDTHNRYADLKVQQTPFFTAGAYRMGIPGVCAAGKGGSGAPYDPGYTVTFNRKDYENYREKHPDCDIYFWVHWRQLSYREIQVNELYGVWRAPFARMAERIEAGMVALHPYKFRKNDDHNARDSFLFDLRDTALFERLV